MKKRFLLLLALVTCRTLYALPVGNPADPRLLCDGLFFEGSCCRILDFCDPGASWCEAFSFRAGYYGDFVFQRSLEIDDHIRSGFVENSEIFTNAGLVILNIWDRIDLFATFGATNFVFDANAVEFKDSSPTPGNLTGTRLEIESGPGFSWSVGTRVIVWQCGCTVLGVEGQYFYTHPDVKKVSVWISPNTFPTYTDDKVSLKYREWQFGLGLSHRINNLVPYAAIKWSHAHVDMDNAIVDGIVTPIRTRLYDLKNRKDVGYALGVTLTDCQKKSLTIEARFADEKALHVNGQIRF